MTTVSRRAFLAVPPAVLLSATPRRVAAATMLRRIDGGLPESFPTQDPAQVRDVVGKAHTNYEGVKELVTTRPALAKASWDWGFGDWESALGAASHMGRRDIAEILIAHGARPNLFTFAMLDQLDAVRAVCVANPGIQRLHGPHGITLLAHARFGKAERVIEYLESIGDADIGQTNVPLDDEAARAYVGDYEPQGAPGVVFKIDIHQRRKVLTFKRDDRPVRFLKHLGDHAFSPSGAPAVRISFDMHDGRAMALAVADGDLFVRALRIRDWEAADAHP